MKVDEELEAGIQSFVQVGLSKVHAMGLLEVINSKPLYKNDKLQFIRRLRQAIYKGTLNYYEFYALIYHYPFITNVKCLSDKVKERGSISSDLLVSSIILSDE